MSTISVCAACLLASILALVLKKQNADYSLIITLCTITIVFVYISGSVVEALTSLKDIYAESTLSNKYLSILLKCTGICLLTEFTSDCCKDSGQAALSGIVVYSGRIFVLVLALPLFSEILAIIKELGSG